MWWRYLAVLVTLFWAVMTGLLIRDTYFPESSTFAEVPPKMVMEMFLSHSRKFTNSLHLFHDKQRCGHATLSARRRPASAGADDYDLQATGVVEKVVSGEVMGDVSWRLEVGLVGAEQWRSLHLSVKGGGQGNSLMLRWIEGDKVPQLEVRKDDQVVMNTQMAMAMVAAGTMGGQYGWVTGLKGDQASSALKISAREGLIDLAGRKRKCYVLTMGVMGLYEVKAIFTEAGELARVDLPDGYELLEPMIHGLESELVER